MNFQPRGLFFEDFQIGDEFHSVSRTITETDVVNFAGLSGDFNQIHTDDEFAKTTILKDVSPMVYWALRSLADWPLDWVL